jgi:hypothetical protein
MMNVGSAVHLRSFLDPPTPKGHTIKGSGLVAYRANRANTTTTPLDRALQKGCESHMQSLGVNGSDYFFGDAQELAETAVVSINGRRYLFSVVTSVHTKSIQYSHNYLLS